MKVKKEYSKEERRNQILTYLRNHETVHRTKLMEQFSITKATLSTQLKAFGWQFQTQNLLNPFLNLLLTASEKFWQQSPAKQFVNGLSFIF